MNGKNGLPHVRISVTLDARALLSTSRLPDGAIERAVSTGLDAGHVGCIPDNAVTYPGKQEDSVFISISEDTKNSFKPVVIDASVRNGAAAANQIIRWEERRGMGEGRNEILSGIASVMKDLAAAYGSPEYRKGHRAG